MTQYGIEFRHMDFEYDEWTVLKDVGFTIPEKIPVPSWDPPAAEEHTICNLIVRFYDVKNGNILVQWICLETERSFLKADAAAEEKGCG